ncbi:MAG: amino acid permease [Myxococcota bacterium]
MSHPERALSLRTATLLVVASMVGTGVFTTSGFLARDLGSNSAVLLCWAVGGVIALFGSLAYGELAAALPNNGGEYALLSRIYHPGVGFIAGFVSLFVGFAAPTAASAIAFGVYAERAFPIPGNPGWWPDLLGVLLIVGVTAIHIATVRRGSRFQDIFTLLKVGLIVALVVASLGQGDLSRLGEGSSWVDATFSGAFAVGLVFVSFAYTGWNAAAYVAGETENPGRSLPRALAIGTGIVTVLYLALNVVFVAAAPMDALSGRVDVAHVAAEAMFGTTAGRILSAVIAWGLISTVGAQIMTGPRIYEAMGHDHPRLGILAKRREGGGPIWATLLQAALSIAMALSASFDALLIYAGASLSLFAALTAAGVFVLRAREPDLPRPYRTSGHPFSTIVFLLLTSWMIVHSLIERPIVAAYAGGTLVLGAVAWWLLGER